MFHPENLQTKRPPFATRVAHLLFLSLQCELFENQLGPAFGHRERPAATSLWWGCSCGYSDAWDDCWPKMNEKKLGKKQKSIQNPSPQHLCHHFWWNQPIFLIPIPQISTSWDFQQRHRPRRSGPKVVTSWDWRCPRNAGAPSWLYDCWWSAESFCRRHSIPDSIRLDLI